MRNLFIYLFLWILIISLSYIREQDEWIRVNQLGYRNDDIKVAVFLSKNKTDLNSFKVVDATTGDLVMSFDKIVPEGALAPFSSCYRLPFTDLKKSGKYRLIAGKAISPEFRIDEKVYDGSSDYLLNYMRQQRSGFNPYIMDSCHTRDGYEIYSEKNDSAHIDVSGGWHDAADYLQYVATSANATYQMLFAFSQNPGAFRDNYLKNGLVGSDSLPDILDECKWGLDWLIKMNPSPGIMYNQIADDRDHIGFRYPDKDTAHYGKGRERPVYLCTGKPQGVFKSKNHTTGIASTAGKFSSAFAKGAQVFEERDPKFSKLLLTKSIDAFNYGLVNPGVCQTAPGTVPYFYEEDNWVDDMELAAIELFRATKSTQYLKYAIEFGRKEIITPWMGQDTARHYQWYPFVNMGHAVIASNEKNETGIEFIVNMKKGLELIELKGQKNPFHVGVPFIWCSNNLIAATITQAHLYSDITGDSTFADLEASHRDWLFGCNPWGTSMIVGLPSKGDYPENSHSSYVVNGGQVYGGLVDGPVYPSIFNSLKYIYLSDKDEYAQFQTKLALYHDDFADYSTNECTMDGTASLTYYLSSLQSSRGKILPNPNYTYVKGAIVRMDKSKRNIFLCFTAHDFSDGFDTISKVLNKHKIKASFFLTGDFCRNPDNRNIISDLVASGHYIGPHSNKHLLYCSWGKRDSLLVSKKEFLSDLENNFNELAKFGISKNRAKVFLPPYEWYNDTIAAWSANAGLTLVENSPGCISNQDWTFPEGKPYFSSDTLFKNLISYEKLKGMNGYILLIHPGTDPRRTDKFYLRLESVLSYLENKNYTFRNFSEFK